MRGVPMRLQIRELPSGGFADHVRIGFQWLESEQSVVIHRPLLVANA